MSFKEKILSKSKTYNFYKNEYEELKIENKKLYSKYEKTVNDYIDLKNEVESLYSDFKKFNQDYDINFNFLNEKINIINHDFVQRDNFNRSLTKELQYAFIFNNSIKDSNWVKNQNFSLVNAAANYSFMYSLYRILNDARPKNILELGLGQTTKLTAQYVNYFKDTNLTILEGDEEWIDIFSNQLTLSDNIKIHKLNLEEFIYEDSISIRFKDISHIVNNCKFDLIIIDGPQGFTVDKDGNNHDLKYSRTNIWQLVPNNLSEEFIIIMDDYNRIGEQNTMNHVKELIHENSIEIGEYTSYGLKAQHAVFTNKYKYIGWI